MSKKSKYRIIEIQDGNKEIKFYIQKRRKFLWWSFWSYFTGNRYFHDLWKMCSRNDEDVKVFASYEEAKNFLDKLVKYQNTLKGEKEVVNIIEHPYET